MESSTNEVDRPPVGAIRLARRPRRGRLGGRGRSGRRLGRGCEAGERAGARRRGRVREREEKGGDQPTVDQPPHQRTGDQAQVRRQRRHNSTTATRFLLRSFRTPPHTTLSHPPPCLPPLTVCRSSFWAAIGTPSTGTLGVPIATGFLQLADSSSKVALSILTRPTKADSDEKKKATLNGLAKQGAKIVYGDIGQATDAELVKLFTGYEILISAVGFEQLAAQPRYIAAAKQAGVKWFVPGEFSVDVSIIGRGSAVPIFDAKLDTRDALTKSGLDYTLFVTGVFSEFILSPFLGLDIAQSTITAQGGFDVPFTTTPLSEIGRQVADAIVTGRGRNQTIFTGETITFAQLADIVEAATGKKLTRKVRTLAEAEAQVAANPADSLARARFRVAFAKGKGTSWPASQTYAAKYNFKVQSFEEFAQKTFAAGK